MSLHDKYNAIGHFQRIHDRKSYICTCMQNRLIFQGEKSASYIGAPDRFRIGLHVLIYSRNSMKSWFDLKSLKTPKTHVLRWKLFHIGSKISACTYIRNGPIFLKPKKCTLDSLLVHATLPRFRIQVHAPQCGVIR